MPTVDLEALQAAIRQETKPSGQWTQRGLSLAAGGKADLVRDIMRGGNRNPSADILVGLARAMKRDLAEFVKGEPPAASARPITKIIMKVTGAVAAGVWLEQTDWPPEEQYDVEVAPLEGAEAGLERFLVEMRGYSMDKTIPPGSVLDCIRVPFSAVVPQAGDIVIVERHVHDLTEMTCKRLDRGENGWELRSESSKPEFQEAIPIGDPNPEQHTDNDIRIIGIVIEARQLHRRRRLR